MKKVLIVIGFLLAACTVQTEKRIPTNSETGTSVSSRKIDISNNWTTKDLSSLRLAIALPHNAIVIEKISSYRGKQISGVYIQSQDDEEYEKTQKTPAGFFRFGVFQLDNYDNEQHFLDSICFPEGKTQGPGYKIVERWTQNGMNFTRFTSWECMNGKIRESAIGDGIIFQNKSHLYLIILPDGDWGEGGLENLDLAIHSIRPIENAQLSDVKNDAPHQSSDASYCTSDKQCPTLPPSITTMNVGTRPTAFASLGANIYVLNLFDQTISIIDTARSNSISTLHVKTSGTVLRTHGSNLFVAGCNKDNFFQNTICIIDTSNEHAVTSIQVGSGPRDFAFVGEKVYVSNYLSNTVSIIDTGNSNVVSTLNVEIGPDDLIALGTKVYVLNLLSHSVSIINTADNNAVTTIKVGPSPSSMAALGDQVYVTDSSNTLFVIDTANDNAVSTVTVGDNPGAFATLGTKIYVANYSDSTVSVIDTSANKVVSTVEVGPYPSAPIALGKMVYLANRHNHTVSVIDTANNNSVSKVNVGPSPWALIAHDTKVYAIDSNSTVAIIDPHTKTCGSDHQCHNSPTQ